MSFDDDIRRFTGRMDGYAREAFERAGQLAQESIVEGSPITGAPGQPVDEGGLRASWIRVYEDANTQTITSSSPYVLSNEDGIARPRGGEYRLRSPTGGRHSFALTVAGWDRIVAAAASGEGGA